MKDLVDESISILASGQNINIFGELLNEACKVNGLIDKSMIFSLKVRFYGIWIYSYFLVVKLNLLFFLVFLPLTLDLYPVSQQHYFYVFFRITNSSNFSSDLI